MPEGTKEVALIAIGFVLAFFPPWLDRKRRLKTHLHAIRAEMQLTRERVENLLKDNVMAPLYRLPVSGYGTSFPVLLAEGVISETDAHFLGNYYCQAQDINRGLDNATSMLQANDDAGLQREFSRLLLKGQAMLGQNSIYLAGLKVVQDLLKRGWWRY